MLRIRLRRVGKKGKPSYRIVVAESAAPRDGAFVEWIGHYDPMVDPPAVTLKADRAIAWLKQGAQPSDAVRRIFDRDGIYERATSGVSSEVVAEAVAEAPEVTVEAAPEVIVEAVPEADSE
jgi:small subunit ribosomal protein S16